MDNLYVLDFNPYVWRLLLRLLAAAVAGFAIGFERKTRSKEAGIRTHCIVSLASCLIMILSKYAFADIGDTDGARIAAQVVTGIGFLGAGMIFYRRDILHGLTTAAGIWATAGIGMAFGAGMYVTAFACTVMIIVFQIILHRPYKLFKERTLCLLKGNIIIEDETTVPKLRELLHIKKILKFRTNSDYNSDNSLVTAEIEFVTDRIYTEEELYSLTKNYTFIKALEKNEEI